MSRENQPLGRDRADCCVALMAREQRNRRNQLAQQRQDGADLERDVLVFDDPEHLAQSPPRNPIAEQEQRICGGAIEPPDPRVQRMADARQPGYPLAHGRRKLTISTSSGEKDSTSTGSPDS